MTRGFHRLLILAVLSSANLLGINSADADGNTGTARVLGRYLAQDFFLHAGIGLKQVRIGDKLTAVLDRWGAPITIQFVGSDAPQQQLIYQAERDTQIIVSALATVKKITVIGGPASSYRTLRGAHFGMPLHQVALLYRGLGDNTDSNDTLAYPEHGIYFEFNRGRLASIILVNPT